MSEQVSGAVNEVSLPNTTRPGLRERVAPPEGPSPGIAGTCHVLFAFDIGFRVDLDAAVERIGAATRLRVMRARRPAPTWFDYAVSPLSLEIEGEPVAIGRHCTAATVDATVHDFGAALLSYRIPLPPTLAELPALSAALYDHPELLADARRRAARLVESAGPAIERPGVRDAVEDYVVHAISHWDGDLAPAELFERHQLTIARALDAEVGGLASEQVQRTTAGRQSYAPTDLAVIDWNAAVLFDREPADVLALLQHANIELLEMRILDRELDGILDRAEHALSRLVRRRFWPSFHDRRMLERFGAIQMEWTAGRESVENAIRLLGNQYLARLYRLAADRLDLPAWHASVRRKLEVSEGLYQRMSDATATRRLETLEWVIILLIALSMLLPFIGAGK